jgi:hypothetical protein
MKKLLLLLVLSASVFAGQAVLVGQWVEGNSRYCKYLAADGSYYIKTIHSSSPCPASD